jgi:hypothetical protein
MNPAFERYIGIAYSGAETPRSSLKGLRVYAADRLSAPLEVNTSPEQLQAAMAEFIDFYNQRRYHEGVGNVTPADVYAGRREQILRRREEQKRQTLYDRFQYNLGRKPTRTTGEPETRNRSLSDGLSHSHKR